MCKELCTTINLIWLTSLIIVAQPVSQPVAAIQTRTIQSLLNAEPSPSSFELRNGLIFVKASVGNRYGHYILDTGAPHLILNQTPLRPNRQGISAGQSLAVQEVTIADFWWGHQYQSNLSALLIDLSYLEPSMSICVEGIIGFDQLKDWEIFIDYASKRILKQPAGVHPIYTQQDPIVRVPIHFIEHLPVVRIELEGKFFNFVIDTGAGENILTPTVFRHLPEEFILDQVSHEVRGLDQKVRRVQKYQIVGLELDSHILPRLSFAKLPLADLRELTGKPIHGILGYPFLRQFLASINYPEASLTLWEANIAY